MLVPLLQNNLLGTPLAGLPVGPIVAKDTDTAGGVIVATLAPHVLINGLGIAVVGDSVTSHGSGSHAAATLSTGSLIVFANGLSVCRTGDLATCGHTVVGVSHVTAS